MNAVRRGMIRCIRAVSAGVSSCISSMLRFLATVVGDSDLQCAADSSRCRAAPWYACASQKRGLKIVPKHIELFRIEMHKLAGHSTCFFRASTFAALL
jgi:hypothetical protein